jgi:hypothetical protein
MKPKMMKIIFTNYGVKRQKHQSSYKLLNVDLKAGIPPAFINADI